MGLVIAACYCYQHVQPLHRIEDLLEREHEPSLTGENMYMKVDLNTHWTIEDMKGVDTDEDGSRRTSRLSIRYNNLLEYIPKISTRDCWRVSRRDFGDI